MSAEEPMPTARASSREAEAIDSPPGPKPMRAAPEAHLAWAAWPRLTAPASNPEVGGFVHAPRKTLLQTTAPSAPTAPPSRREAAALAKAHSDAHPGVTASS